jgi:hypothetical protein
MAQLDNRNPVTLEELMVSTLAMTDALAKKIVIDLRMSGTASGHSSCASRRSRTTSSASHNTFHVDFAPAVERGRAPANAECMEEFAPACFTKHR